MANSPEQDHAASGPARTAFVTGGASGIGLAIVGELVDRGWHVVAADISQTALDEMGQGTLGSSSQVSLACVDVTSQADVDRVLGQIPAQRPLKALVNCAGIGRSVPFEQTSVADLRSILEVNLVGTFIVCQAGVRLMNAGGAIVNISSGSGLKANAGRAAYGASKAAVELMSKVMAVELAPRGIRVNTVAPGPIETPLVARMHSPADRAAALAAVPMRRYGSPHDVACAVCYLLDDVQAGYVTGETLCVDGGFFAAGAFAHPGSR